MKSGISQNAYARSRKERGLPGGNPNAVVRAVASGRLKDSVVDGRIVDVDLADREWEANTDHTKREHAEGVSKSEASAVETFWKSKQAELKFLLAAGELVEARDVEARLVAVFTECKTKLLGLPSRAKQALPHLSLADISTLDALVRESLEALSK